ncbi:MAG: TraB/GumN family protein [Syntrophales bacterium]
MLSNIGNEKNIRRISYHGKEIILIGTAHISRVSADLVERVIKEEKPDSICVELCPSRYEAICRKEQWQEMDIVKVGRQKWTSLLLFQLIMASFQKRMALKFNFTPGEEMLRAIRLAEEAGADIVLADREIRITILRAWRQMGIRSKIRLLPDLLLYLILTEEIREEDIEKLKQEDLLETVLQTVGRQLPELKTTVINERDQFMAHKIGSAPGVKIVAVVGAGHVPGIAKHIDKPTNLDVLNEIPPKHILERFAGWGLSAVVIAIFIAGFIISGSGASLKMIGWWSAITAFLAAFSTLILLSHPLTIIASALFAPIATLYPWIAAGWIAGLTEASLRKPKVKDFLDLSEDITSIRGFFRNRITRILIIVTFVNLTTSIGTFIAIPVMMRYFK